MDTLAESYLPTNADPVKGYSQRAEDHDYIDYLKVWTKQGLRHPNVYISAFNCMAAGWFSWYECIPLMNNDWRSAHITELIPEWVSIHFEGKRYLYPIIYSAPLLAAWCMYVYKEDRE